MFNDEEEYWQKLGECRNHDPELWFPPRDKVLYKPIADKAKDICYGRNGNPPCPVRVECTLYAEKENVVHGIWGGLSHRERNALRRKAEKNRSTLEEWVRAGKR